MSELFEKRDNKVILHVDVYPVKQVPAFSYPSGYVAIANEITACWSHGETIDAAINKFKDEYGSMLTMQFQNGEFEFDFAVKLAG